MTLTGAIAPEPLHRSHCTEACMRRNASRAFPSSHYLGLETLEFLNKGKYKVDLTYSRTPFSSRETKSKIFNATLSPLLPHHSLSRATSFFPQLIRFLVRSIQLQ